MFGYLKEPMDGLTKGERPKSGLFPKLKWAGVREAVKICIYLLPYSFSLPQVETEIVVKFSKLQAL